MSRVAKPRMRFDNVAELLDRLGGVSARRVCLNPLPGTATKADLIRLHEQTGKLYELVDRTLVEKPMGYRESHVALELAFYLRLYLMEHDLGFLSGADGFIEILPDLVRGPDSCFVPWTRRPDHAVPDDPISPTVPTLAAEILSPSNRRGETLRKLKEYFLAGVLIVWVIDPAKRTADVYTAPDAKTALGTTGTLDGGDVLPGFQLPLAKLFERLAKPAPGRKPRKKK